MTLLYSLFVHNIDSSTNNLNDDLKKISKYAFQWKLSFKTGPTKWYQEVIFSQKLSRPNHLPLQPNDSFVNQTNSKKHLGLLLNSKVNFEEHLQKVYKKATKTTAVIPKFKSILPRVSLLTIYIMEISLLTIYIMEILWRYYF